MTRQWDEWAPLLWGKSKRCVTVLWRGEFSNAYTYMKWRRKEHAVRPFSVLFSDRVRGNSHKVKYRRFHLNIKKWVFFTGRMTKQWHSFHSFHSFMKSVPTWELSKHMCTLSWITGYRLPPLSNVVGPDNILKFLLTSTILHFCDTPFHHILQTKHIF